MASVAGPLATIGYTYDELGRVVDRSIGASGNVQTTGYDSLGRTESIVNPLGIFDFSYVDTSGRLDHIDYPNSQTVEYDYYDNVGDQRLKEIKNLDAGGG